MNDLFYIPWLNGRFLVDYNVHLFDNNELSSFTKEDFFFISVDSMINMSEYNQQKIENLKKFLK